VPSAAYFRRQADICLRLSLIASDDVVATRLLAMARDYRAAGDALEPQACADAPMEPNPSADAAEGSGEGMPIPPDAPSGK
jgi:hypothetical protein